MKKALFIAAFACIALASCKKDQMPSVAVAETQQEISAVAFNSLATKGYTGWASGKTNFEEVVDPSDPDAVASDRDMCLSAYNKTKSADFFVGENYAKGDDDLWHANPKIYYPLGKDEFNFLAYSVSNSNYIGSWEGANKVTLEVTDAFCQNDIIFASGTANAADPTVDLTFKHAQAWVHFNINITAESEKDLAFKVNSITWPDIYSQGLLTIEADAAAASTASWNYFTQTTSDVVMIDPVETFPISLAPATEGAAGEPSQIDMLFPADQTHGNFVLNYSIGNQTNLDYECPITAAKWEMGHKYVYNVTITINEVTAAPIVEVFVEETAIDIEL